jgi:hypothetical protein
MPANTIITVRKGSSSEWTSANPVLASGELGFDTTNRILKIGDGSTAWNSLNNHNHSAVNIVDFNESVDDRVSSLLVAGSGIRLSYNDIADSLSIAVSGALSQTVIFGGTP